MPQQRLTPPVQSGQSTSVPPRSKITARGACINQSPLHKSLSCLVSLQTLVYHMISNLLLCFKLFLSGLQRAAAGVVAPIGVNFSTAVILSTAKDLRSAQREILSVAKDDRWRAVVLCQLSYVRPGLSALS